MKSADCIGSILRKFYSIYGLSQEGPPKDLNISEILPDDDLHYELDTLSQICANLGFFREFKKCRDMVEELATRSAESPQLAEELDTVLSRIEIDVDHLTNGIFWYSLAAQLDPRGNKHTAVDLLPNEIPPIFRDMLQLQGSLIFRLYITLVYMKEGAIQDILKEGNSLKLPILILYRQLLNCDYIRHLRNALSHANFEPSVAGIIYRDNTVLYGATPGFLDWLCMWIFTLHHICLLVIEKKNNI